MNPYPGGNVSSEKLVRDRIPEMIRAKGETPVVRVAADGELQELLCQKLCEEARELLEAKGESVYEELADVLEVVMTLMRVTHIRDFELDALRRTKREERGGFEKGFVLRIG